MRIIKEKINSNMILFKLVYEDNKYKVKKYYRGIYQEDNDITLNTDNEEKAIEVFDSCI